MFFTCPSPGKLQPGWRQAAGTAPQGSRGWERGLLGRAQEGPGGQAGVWSGRRPALIGTRWQPREPGPAALILPGVPATRRGRGRAGCRLSQVWDTLGERLFMWLPGRPATQHVGEAGAWGRAAVGGSGDPESHSQPMPGSRRQGRGSGSESVRILVVRAHAYLSALSAWHSSEHSLGLSSPSSRHPRRWVLPSSPLTDGETEAQQG